MAYKPSPHRLESWLGRLSDWVFGYDFFVSYAHDDGLAYPKALKEKLEQAGFKVCLQ